MTQPLEDQIIERFAQTVEWLAENAPYCSADQKHLDAGTEAQAYWHYGYAIALRDVQLLIQKERSP